jgi:hypothetical protein
MIILQVAKANKLYDGIINVISVSNNSIFIQPPDIGELE